MVSYIGISLFVIGSLSLLFVSIIALRNDPSYIVNQLFSLGFICFFLYYVIMGGYFFPDMNFTGVDAIILVFLGLLFLNISLALFAVASIYIQHGTLIGNQKELGMIISAVILGIISALIIYLDSKNEIILLIAFIGLNFGLTINSLDLIFILFRIYRYAKDPDFKNKIKILCINFILLGVLSISGWTITLFVSLPADLSTLPPVLFTLIASLLLIYSFRSKIKSKEVS